MAQIIGPCIGDSSQQDFVSGQDKLVQHNLGVPARWVEIRKADGKIVHGKDWAAGSDPNNQIIVFDLGLDLTSATVIVTGIAPQNIAQQTTNIVR